MREPQGQHNQRALNAEVVGAFKDRRHRESRGAFPQGTKFGPSPGASAKTTGKEVQLKVAEGVRNRGERVCVSSRQRWATEAR